MTHTLQYSPHDQLAELLATATGRFGRRRVRTIALPDPEMAPARTTTVVLMRERIENGEYQIDSHHVADAIVDRLCVGGLTTPLHKQSA